MKRLIVFIISTMFFITACSSKGYDEYKEAYQKLESVKSGKGKMNIKVDIDFNTAELGEVEKREISRFEELRYDSEAQFNNNQVIVKNYFNVGGIGYDSIYYQENDEKQYLYMPMFNEYFKVKSWQEQFKENDIQEIFKKIRKVWVDILEDEDVIKSKNTVIETEQGNVKANIYTINFTEEQLNKLVKESINILMKENALEVIMKNYKIKEEDIKEDINYITKLLNKMQIITSSGKVYVDYDGYPILETYEIEIGFSDTQSKEIEKIKIEFSHKVEELNKKQELKFPKINDANLKDIEKYFKEEYKNNNMFKSE